MHDIIFLVWTFGNANLYLLTYHKSILCLYFCLDFCGHYQFSLLIYSSPTLLWPDSSNISRPPESPLWFIICLFPSFQCLMILVSLFLLRLMWPWVLTLHVLSLFTSSSHVTHLSAQLLHEHFQNASTLIYRVEYYIRYVSCCMRHDYTKLIWHAQTPKPVPLLNFSHDFTHLQQMCTISWMLKYKLLLCSVFHLNWIFSQEYHLYTTVH